MKRTISIYGSDFVLALYLRPGHYYRGKWENVLITGVGKDEDTPLEVRTALVGLTIPTIFTKETVEEQIGVDIQIPEGLRLAYCTDVIDALKSARKREEARLLVEKFDNPLDLYGLEKEIWELV